MSNRKPKPRKGPLETQESGSTIFHRIGSTEFWLSPQNKIFLVFRKKVIVPSLQGSSIVKFDDPAYVPPKGVAEKCRELLRMQQDIRKDWPTPFEDEAAFNFC